MGNSSQLYSFSNFYPHRWWMIFYRPSFSSRLDFWCFVLMIEYADLSHNPRTTQSFVVRRLSLALSFSPSLFDKKKQVMVRPTEVYAESALLIMWSYFLVCVWNFGSVCSCIHEILHRYDAQKDALRWRRAAAAWQRDLSVPFPPFPTIEHESWWKPLIPLSSIFVSRSSRAGTHTWSVFMSLPHASYNFV